MASHNLERVLKELGAPHQFAEVQVRCTACGKVHHIEASKWMEQVDAGSVAIRCACSELVGIARKQDDVRFVVPAARPAPAEVRDDSWATDDPYASGGGKAGGGAPPDDARADKQASRLSSSAAFGGESPESYYDEGLTASVKGDVRRAAQCFERVIQTSRDAAMTNNAQHQLAKCYLRVGRNKKAAELLDAVVKRNPQLRAARLEYGQALLNLNLPDRAREEFSAVLAADSTNARALLGLATVSFQTGDWHAATELCKRSLDVGRANFSAVFLLGRAARLAGDYSTSDQALIQADNVLEKSTELSPDAVEGHYFRGEVQFVREDFPKALENYRAAEDRSESGEIYSAFGETFTRVDILAKQALCYQRMDRKERAREVADAILKLEPDHKLAHAIKNME